MSAAGRTEGVRREYDHYVTPPWSVRRLLEKYDLPVGASVIDPCAANGELLTALHAARPDLALIAIEIRESCRGPLAELAARGVIQGFWIGDFLEFAKTAGAGEVDYVITNPPFELARDFITECDRLCRRGNVHLLRLNFLGGLKRHTWIAAHKPGIIVSANRPYFTGWGGDATEYAWLVYKDAAWRGRWEITDVTPEDEIKSWNAIARAMFPEANPKLRVPTPPVPSTHPINLIV